MGYELRRQLREALGPNITGLQRAVALEIADDAHERSRLSVVSLEDLARWTGAKDAGVVRNALKRLAASGWEFRVPIGEGKDGRALFAIPGRRMTFKVPPFEGGATATPYGLEGGAGAHSEGATATPSGGKGEQGLPLGGAGATPSDPGHALGNAAGRPGFDVIESVPQGGATATPSGQQGGATATPSSKETEVSNEEEASSAQGGATATPCSPARDLTAEEKKEFGNFWTLYPKSRDMEKTRAEWTTAVLGGIPAEKITAAAVGYAREKAGEEFRFIKYSANWLKARGYEDDYAPAPDGKPQLRAVSGGHQTYRNPDDDSVWDEDLI